MRQHPIPQNVTQYQFRLVGNMTLKQFLELAAGLILAYLIYLSNLIFILKLPLSATLALLGIGMAFFPLEERPLDQWILNFFKAIYSPTIYRWQKEPTPPSIFTYSPSPHQPTTPKPTTAKPTPLPNPIQSNQEADNDPQLQLLNQLFKEFPITPPKSTATVKHPTPIKPSIRIRKLKSPFPPTPKPLNLTFPSPTQNTTPPSPSKPQPKPTTPKPTTTKPQVIFQNSQPASETPTSIAPTETIDIAPLTPTKPNLVAGLVTDANNKLLPNLIVEIVDLQGLPQRAVKTNALGQFSISTPLPPGEYFVKIDNDDLHIPTQKIKVNNQIIPPIHLHPSQQPTTNN